MTKIKYNNEIKNDPSTTTTVCTHVCIQSLEQNKQTRVSWLDVLYEWDSGLLATLCSLPHFHSNFPPQFEKQKAAFLCSLPHRLACNDTHMQTHTAHALGWWHSTARKANCYFRGMVGPIILSLVLLSFYCSSSTFSFSQVLLKKTL